MNVRITALFALPLVLVTGIGRCADVSGPLLYDGLSLSQTFTDITAAQITANPWDGSDPVPGTIDLAGDSYRVSGLDTVRYSINIYLDRTAPDTQVWNHGDLLATIDVTPENSSDSLEKDCNITYVYRILSPIDSNVPLDGSGSDCTAYPTAVYPITFSIGDVPRATSYESTATQSECPTNYLGSIITSSSTPSAEIDWGTAGEDFQMLRFACEGMSGRPLCSGPAVRYNDSAVWALFLRNGDSAGRTIHHTDAVVIPAVAAAPGADGTYWSSALSITNLESRDRDISLTFTPRDTNGLNDFLETTIYLPGNSQVSWSNVLDDLFSTTGAGSLEIRGANLAVASRTSTPDPGSGSYGQGIPPIQPKQLLASDRTASASIGSVEESEAFRTNLGLSEVWGEAVSVTVTVFDYSMNTLGSKAYNLQPYENIQVNRVAQKIGGVTSLTDGIITVTVTSGDGRIGAYLSVVDNSSGDPTYIAIARQEPIGS